MREIRFYIEDISFKLTDKARIRQWIDGVLKREGFRPGAINYIFCSDVYLIEINKQFLQHDTYTDIVTFPYEDTGNRISGDLFISVDRVRDNASQFGVSELDELHRVMVHGVLHLCGYKDKSKEQQHAMRTKENESLEKRWFKKDC